MGIHNKIGDLLKDGDYLKLPGNTDNLIYELIAGIITVLLCILLGKIAIILSKKMTTRLLRDKPQKRIITLARALDKIFKYMIWFLVIVILLSIYGIDVKPILAGAGILSVAVAFGTQTIIGDFLNGLFLIAEDSFNVGDIVEIDSFTGEVLAIGLRTTKIKNWRGPIKIINNGQIKTIINHSKNHSLAIVDISIEYKQDLDKIETLIENNINVFYDCSNLILTKPQYLGVQKFDDSGLGLRIIAECVSYEHFGVQRAIRKELHKLFNNNNIKYALTQIVLKEGE